MLSSQVGATTFRQYPNEHDIPPRLPKSVHFRFQKARLYSHLIFGLLLQRLLDLLLLFLGNDHVQQVDHLGVGVVGGVGAITDLLGGSNL